MDAGNIVWTTPSKDHNGSMPIGNGDVGLNVWVEENGDLLFYISKTDAWDENACLLKLGRVRVSLSPNPCAAGADFTQELDLATGSIRIQASADNQEISLLIWVDANQPVVRVEIESSVPIEARARLELWRAGERTRDRHEAACPVGLRSPDDRETVYPDTVLPTMDDAILWCHRNGTSCWSENLEHQGVAAWTEKSRDPLLDRTFGGIMRGDGLVRDGDCELRTETEQSHVVLAIHPLTAQTDTTDAWIQAITKQASDSDATPLESTREAHQAWWQTFWETSWIRVSGTPEAEVVSQGYKLQRFINACGGRGAFPIKFNGSIFTVDGCDQDNNYDADYRRWGGGYWFQNTRLIYWSMITSGDFEMMQPWFDMYVGALPFGMARTKAHFGISDAAIFPETMTFWGAFLNRNYGYDRGDLEPGLSESTYIRRYWQGVIELLAVLLDHYDVSRDLSVLRDKLLVLAPPLLRFYRVTYKCLDEDGRIIFRPSQSLETWHDTINPSPDIAGLQWVLDRLLTLPESEVSHELRAEWSEFRDRLPPLPTRTDAIYNRTKVLPALQYDQLANFENCELYTVFPYRLFGVGKPDLEVGRATWEAREIKRTGGWCQDAIQAALLGLTEEATAAVVKNFSTWHEHSRFPAFWGPGFDWVPDQCHGSVACIALQRMLLQCDDGAIHLLPAWPADWNVEFKLHAPNQTTVEGSVENGKLLRLEVTPEDRSKDVVVMDPA
jgi:hypothetical protein